MMRLELVLGWGAPQPQHEGRKHPHHHGTSEGPERLPLRAHRTGHAWPGPRSQEEPSKQWRTVQSALEEIASCRPASFQGEASDTPPAANAILMHMMIYGTSSNGRRRRALIIEGVDWTLRSSTTAPHGGSGSSQACTLGLGLNTHAALTQTVSSPLKNYRSGWNGLLHWFRRRTCCPTQRSK